MRGSVARLAPVALMPAALLAGCAGLAPSLRGDTPARRDEGRTLTAVVAELQLHLRDDTYRLDRARTEEGQNVFALALWRLERLRERRARASSRTDNVDIVIEFARGRTLERLRRYEEAAEAYSRVELTGSRLGVAAQERAEIIRTFARHSGPLDPVPATPEDALERIEERIHVWHELALSHARTEFESLALEEAEAWEMLRVEWFARHRDPREAIEACRRLVERHHASKLYAEHMIRLGDLYADAAHQVFLRARAKLGPFDTERYEAFLDQAFAAYEVAAEQREGSTNDAAESKIEALLAQHEGVRGHVP
jgi:tetratricopeptide (TPR) repeat protein